jgi:hypothetical protein
MAAKMEAGSPISSRSSGEIPARVASPIELRACAIMEKGDAGSAVQVASRTAKAVTKHPRHYCG